jgi:hypothetical protein
MLSLDFLSSLARGLMGWFGRFACVIAAPVPELLEVSVPADMGTEPCDPPPGH